MASTYSSNLGIELIGAGDQSGTWGTTTNNNLGTLLEQSICGYGAAAVTTGNTTTITMPNGASGTARNMVISVTGTGGASTVLAVPDSRTKIYTIFNGATGAITVRTVSGSGISVPTSTKAILYCDGTNVVDAVNYFSSLTLGAALPVASGGTSLTTLTANNVILGNGTSAPQFVAPTTNGNILTANGTTWVSSTPAYVGTVTSVGVSGGTTGLTTSGGPITTSGTITLAGTLAVANGGTGVTSTTAYSVYTGNSAGTGFTAIANGTTGQILTATTSGAPSWAAPATNGTVTSVAAITLGTTGTDLSSTVATGTTTPVITLNVPTASASNRGVLSAADWTTFNNKGSGTVTSVTGTAPVVSSGGVTPAISMAAASTSVSGYLTSTDWNTFNGKQAAGSYVTVGGALGTPSSGTLTNCTFPTLNQNTTGSSGSCTGNAATATTATTATLASTVTVTYNTDTNSTYQMLWGSGTSVYGTAGIYCNPYADSIYASAYYYTSDERKKKNIRSIESPIALINLLDGKYFDWINTNKSDAGLIAQDVQKAIPEAVSIGEDGFLSVNSAAVIGLLVNAIKDQQKQIDALTAMVEEIRNA